MADENKKQEVKEQGKQNEEKKVEETKQEVKTEDKKEEKKVVETKTDQKTETEDQISSAPSTSKSSPTLAKQEEVAGEKKVDKKKQKEDLFEKKEEAVAIGRNLHMSKKHGVYICDFIKNKKIDEAINILEEVKKLKQAVPFKGEIPHRKGVGMMSGRYPVKGAGLFIDILKGLKGNVIVNGLDLDKSMIYFASTSWASRPVRRENRRAKRTNVILKAREVGK